MNIVLPIVMIGVIALTGVPLSAQMERLDDFVPVSPHKPDRTSGSASIPPGLEAVAVHGDPGQKGWFVLKLKLPADYTIPPQSHSRPGVVVVRSGTLHIARGEEFDRDRARPLKGGSFFAFPPGTAYFAFTEEETVIQLSSTGPWALGDVNAGERSDIQVAGSSR